MSLQDVAATESVLAQMASIRSITSVSKKVALQVLGVQISLVTVWTREFSLFVLLRYHRFGSRGGNRVGDWWPTRYAWQYSPPTLRSHHMYWLRLLAGNVLMRRLTGHWSGGVEGREGSQRAGIAAIGWHGPNILQSACRQWGSVGGCIARRTRHV